MSGRHDVFLHCQILVTGLIIGAFIWLVLRAMAKRKQRPRRRRTDENFHYRSCEFCMYSYPSECGRYGCPNCNGEGL